MLESLPNNSYNFSKHRNVENTSAVVLKWRYPEIKRISWEVKVDGTIRNMEPNENNFKRNMR